MRCRLNVAFTLLVVCILTFQQDTFAQSRARIGSDRYDRESFGEAGRQRSGAYGLERYMTIARNNLFAPLGTGDEVKQQEYVLTGILGNVAIIQPVGSAASYYVTTGDTFGDGAKLVLIGKDSVTIIHEGNRIELELDRNAPVAPSERKGAGQRARSPRPGAPAGRGR